MIVSAGQRPRIHRNFARKQYHWPLRLFTFSTASSAGHRGARRRPHPQRSGISLRVCWPSLPAAEWCPVDQTLTVYQPLNATMAPVRPLAGGPGSPLITAGRIAVTL
jgi:hypothetical protein